MSKIIIHNRSDIDDSGAFNLLTESLKSKWQSEDKQGYVGARVYTVQTFMPNKKKEYVVSRFNQAKSVRYVISNFKQEV